MRATAPSHAPQLPMQLSATSTAAIGVMTFQPNRVATRSTACMTPDDGFTSCGRSAAKTLIVPRI